MRTYRVFIEKNGKTGAIENVILLETGFNVQAALFGMLWLLWARLWLWATLSGLLVGLALLMPPALGSSALLSLDLATGFFANDLLASALDRRGNHYFTGLAQGNGREDAQTRFLEEINRQFRDKNQVIY
ncbi:MAG: DUF2628 domain-containing protein [Rickettsiales bacterium]|jgi:hypothetical protein|nr:DUF2628 domain-containing protein [Rickettsiales bacterium]